MSDILNEIVDKIDEETAEPSDTVSAEDESKEEKKLPEGEEKEIKEVDSSQKDELEALREELCRLRAELEEKKSSLERLGKEISDFSELFPGEQLTSLPDSVWESVRGGIPLAAAYALYKRKTELRAEQASLVNKKNNGMSTGAIGRDTTENFYTPDEVRAMTRSEIKKNYSKILDSMKKWN